MVYRQHKTFWYQFCNLKHFLKAENSEDIFASSCEQNSVTCHVTQSDSLSTETELLLELCLGTPEPYSKVIDKLKITKQDVTKPRETT